jgi:hypothetical protein
MGRGKVFLEVSNGRRGNNPARFLQTTDESPVSAAQTGRGRSASLAPKPVALTAAQVIATSHPRRYGLAGWKKHI